MCQKTKFTNRSRKFLVSFAGYFMLVSWLLFVPRQGLSQDGATLFEDLCSDCHSIGDGVYYGPDLKGVNKKHSDSWLLSFITSSKTMIAAGDEKAVAIFNEFKQKKMPDTDASEAEIKAIVAYIKSFSPAEVTPPPDNNNGNNDTPPDNGNTTTETNVATDIVPENSGEIPVPVQSAEPTNNQKVQTLEEKVDKLLKYYERTSAGEVTKEDIAKGKSLFYGKTAFANGAPSCVSCHNTKMLDTLNWNPSAFDLAKRFDGTAYPDIEEVLSNPSSKRMKNILEDHQLTEREAYTIASYLLTVKTNGLITSKAPSKRVSLYVALGLLIIILLFDLFVTHIIKPKFISIVIILVGCFFEIRALGFEGKNIGLSTNYQPDQPIKFSHKVHAKENGIDCKYCHSSVEYSKISGIPSENVCLNCHLKIKEGTHSGTFEISKIYDAIKNKEPIKWVKIHNLPDYVFYSHAQHVGAGKLDCKECHGDVADMDRVKQVNSLSMGWCLDCHRRKAVQFDNPYYAKYHSLREKLKAGEIDTVRVSDIGGEDCQKCHY